MTMQNDNTAMLPWHDQVDWWNNPRLAYRKGLDDGYALGHADANAELVRALSRMLSDNETDNYVDAVAIHQRRLDQARQRRIQDGLNLMRAPLGRAA